MTIILQSKTASGTPLSVQYIDLLVDQDSPADNIENKYVVIWGRYADVGAGVMLFSSDYQDRAEQRFWEYTQMEDWKIL